MNLKEQIKVVINDLKFTLQWDGIESPDGRRLMKRQVKVLKELLKRQREAEVVTRTINFKKVA